jgi:peptidyl-prolyl cis-trans isomerase C/foldase protein PrsA
MKHPKGNPRAAWAVTALVLAGALSTAGLTGCSNATPGPSPSQERIVARVDGAPLTTADLERVKEAALLGGTALDDDQALRQLVGEELVRREAKRLGIAVTRTEIDERVDDLATAAGGLDQLRSQLADGGLTMSELRDSVESVLMGEELEDAKYANLEATRADARAFYEKNRQLFSTAAAVRLGDLAVRREGIAQNAIDRINDGQPFENASRQFSVDPELKAKSGMLGWVALSSLPKPARSAVAALDVGEMTAPVQVGPLWHVFKLLERRPARTPPFAAVAKVIRAELTRRQRAEALAEWVERERGTADIVLSEGS